MGSVPSGSGTGVLGLRSHTPRLDATCLVVVLDCDGRILSANAGFRRIFGLPPRQTPSEPIWEALPEQGVAYSFKAILKGVRVGASAFEKECFIGTSNGGWHHVIWSHSPILASDGAIAWLVSIGVDVADYEKDGSALRRLRGAVRVIEQFNEALVRATGEAELLDAACRIAVEVGGYEFAWVGFVEDGGQKAVVPVAHAGQERGYLTTMAIPLTDPEQFRSPTVTAVRTGLLQVAKSLGTDPAPGPWREDAARQGYASWIALPLMKDNSVFGVLSVYAREPDAFDEVEVKLLTGLAADLAYGISALRERDQRQTAEADLRASETRMGTLVDAVPSGVTIVDTSGRITFANPQAQRILGLSGDAITKLYHNDPAWRITAVDGGPFPEEQLPFVRVMSTGEPVYEVELAVERPDGTRITLSVNAAPLRGPREELTGVVTAFRDITALKEAESRLAESEQRFRMLTEAAFDGVIVQADGVLLEADEKVARIFGYEPHELVGKSMSNFVAPESGEAVTAYMAAGWPLSYEGWGIRKDGSRFPFEACGKQAGYRGQMVRVVAIRDLTQRKQTEAQLRRTIEGVVSVLASTVERRDPYTAGHQRRTAELACAIAHAMDLPPEQVEGLRMAASVHDLGKLSVPAEILSRPGTITRPEMDMIKRHPETASEVLSAVEFPWPITDIVLQHHERMDGSGYPAQLTGDQLMLEARVLAVADVVEAMASHRPYRPALGIEAALAEISEQSGKLYDRQVVGACLKVFHEGEFQFRDAVV